MTMGKRAHLELREETAKDGRQRHAHVGLACRNHQRVRRRRSAQTQPERGADHRRAPQSDRLQQSACPIMREASIKHASGVSETPSWGSGVSHLGEHSLACERPAIDCRSEIRLPEQLVVADCAEPVGDLEHG